VKDVTDAVKKYRT